MRMLYTVAECTRQPRKQRLVFMHSRALLLLAALLLMAHPVRTQKTTRPRHGGLGPAAEKWVSATLKKMTMEEKLGQMVVVYYHGAFLPEQSAEFAELVRQVEKNHVGGLMVQTRAGALGVQRSQVYPTAALANELQRRVKVPLLVAADFERGTAMRLIEGTPFPHAMAVAAAGDPRDAYTMGKITALEARAAGVNWIFGPVADVNSDPTNPIINTRAFGEDPKRVAEFVAAFIRGVEENGALATAKHFPGHGDTNVDSHMAMPVVNASRERMEQVEFVPFRAAIAAGVSSIMTAHLAAPALEPDKELPATLSSAILTGVLRKELGYDGIVVSDSLDMAGIAVKYPVGDAAVRAVAAGADVLLVNDAADAALAALKEAVADGRIPDSRVNEAVERILRAKARVGLHREKLVDLSALNANFARPEYLNASQAIADRGVTLLRDDAKLLPLDATVPRRTLLVILAGDPDVLPGQDLERELRWRSDGLEVLRADTQYRPVEALKLPKPENYDVAIAAVFVRVADRKGSIGIPENQAAVVDQLIATGKPVIVLCFGSPYLVERFPNAKTWVSVFSTVEVAQRAGARAIFGQTAIGGKLPVSIPGVAHLRRGDGQSVAATTMKLRPAGQEMASRLAPAYAVLDAAVKDGAFPGGVLAVGYRADLVIHAFGRQTYDARAAAVTQDTIYDLASLTKPVAVGTVVAMLAEAREIELDAPVARYLPEWLRGGQVEWRAKVTVRNLLLHNSGLPAHRKYYEQGKGKKAIAALAAAEPLLSEPGTKIEYSDIGFILLGEIIERVTGLPLEVVVSERVLRPLGMSDTQFRPGRGLRTRIPPTEDDTTFRRRLVHSEAHDQNAWAMGGVAGHAGLFATARDMAAFTQMWLNGGLYAHQRLLRRSTVNQFTTRVGVGDMARTAAWDVPHGTPAAGKYFGARSYGHNGFTGTSIWVDPEKQLFVVLLTNRIHPSVENIKIRQARPVLHDAIVEALGLVSTPAAPSAR